MDSLAAALASAALSDQFPDVNTADGLRRQLEAVEHALIEEAVRAFRAELDPLVLEALQAEGVHTPAAYNHYRAVGPRLQRNRVQAALTHPRFSGALRQDWGLRRAVDAGAPLTPALAARYGVREATVRRTRALPAIGAGPSTLSDVLKRVDRLPPHLIPSTQADWAVFQRLFDGVEGVARLVGADLGDFLKPFCPGWQTGLVELEAKLQGPVDIDAIYEMARAAYLYGVRPVLQSALAASGVRLTLTTEAPATFFPLWFSRYGLARLLRMANEWRATYGRLRIARLGAARRLSTGGALEWPGLLPAGATMGGLRVVELTSYAALDLEGQRQSHCVASYAIKCLMQDSSIFSVRDATGRSLSTFEVHLPAAGKPTLLRHHAARNAQPTAELQVLVQQFVASLLTGVPQHDIDSVRERRRAIGGRVLGQLATPNTRQDPLSVEELRALAEAAVSLHPAECREAGVAAFLYTRGQEVLRALGFTDAGLASLWASLKRAA